MRFSVRIVHDHLSGTRIEGALHCCVGLLGHPSSGHLVVFSVTANLVSVDESRNAFHVHRNEDLELLRLKRGQEKSQRQDGPGYSAIHEVSFCHGHD